MQFLHHNPHSVFHLNKFYRAASIRSHSCKFTVSVSPYKSNPIQSKRFLLMGNAHGHRKHFNHGVNTSPPTNNAPSPFNKYSSSEPTSRNSTSTSKMESLPYAHVDSSLRALAAQAEGFGRSAIGGLHGSVYCVTNLAGAICFPLFMNKFNLMVSEVVGMQELRC